MDDDYIDDFEEGLEDEDLDEVLENKSGNDYIVDAENLRKSKKKRTIIDLGRESFLVIEDGKRYTPTQIDEMADEFLRAATREIDPDTGRPKGIKGVGGDAPFLLEEHYRYRRRREIYNTTGIAEPYLSRLAAERHRSSKPKNTNTDNWNH